MNSSDLRLDPVRVERIEQIGPMLGEVAACGCILDTIATRLDQLVAVIAVTKQEDQLAKQSYEKAFREAPLAALRIDLRHVAIKAADAVSQAEDILSEFRENTPSDADEEHST